MWSRLVAAIPSEAMRELPLAPPSSTSTSSSLPSPQQPPPPPSGAAGRQARDGSDRSIGIGISEACRDLEGPSLMEQPAEDAGEHHNGVQVCTRRVRACMCMHVCA